MHCILPQHAMKHTCNMISVTWFRTTHHLPAITTTIITIAIPLHSYSKGILLLFIYILLLQLLYNNITNCTKCFIEALPFSCQNYETFIFAFITIPVAIKCCQKYSYLALHGSINATTYNTHLVLTYESIPPFPCIYILSMLRANYFSILWALAETESATPPNVQVTSFTFNFTSCDCFPPQKGVMQTNDYSSPTPSSKYLSCFSHHVSYTLLSCFTTRHLCQAFPFHSLVSRPKYVHTLQFFDLCFY